MDGTTPKFIEVNKENGFDFLTEAQYDEIMREATVALEVSREHNSPYAFHNAFELALRRFTEMRDENEGEGDVLKRKLESFMDEVKSLEKRDSEPANMWLSKFVKMLVHRSNLDVRMYSGELTAIEKNNHLYNVLKKSLSESLDVLKINQEKGFIEDDIEKAGEVPKKPPIGLRPRFIMLEDRLEEILSAVERYTKAGHYPPAEWLIEASQISQELSERDAGS